MFKNQWPGAETGKFGPSFMLPSGNRRELNPRKLFPAKRKASPSRCGNIDFHASHVEEFKVVGAMCWKGSLWADHGITSCAGEVPVFERRSDRAGTDERDFPMVKALRVNGDRLWSRLMRMTEIGATGHGGCNRQAFSDANMAGRRPSGP